MARRAVVAVAAATVALAIGLVSLGRCRSGRSRTPGDGAAAGAPRSAPASSRGGASRTPDVAPAARLPDEELVRLDEGVRVESVASDREWVCAGESTWLRATVAGAGPSLVPRWIWSDGTRDLLQSGATLRWTAPSVPGVHRIVFQACRDLGGRRVGLLAEGRVDVEVRDCGPEEGQDFEPLRLVVRQRGQGRFALTAIAREDLAVVEYLWDFGDGTSATTEAADTEHTYLLAGMGADEIRSFRVEVSGRTADGVSHSATGAVQVHGLDPTDGQRFRLTVAQAEGGAAAIRVENLLAEAVTWESVERTVAHVDGRQEARTVPWRDLIDVAASLPGGGFDGAVAVAPADAGDDVRQVTDRLLGRDASGDEIVLAWSPFERAPPDVGAPPPPEYPAR